MSIPAFNINKKVGVQQYEINMSQNTDQFYAQLPTNCIALGDLLHQEALFRHLPPDWVVIVAAIVNSDFSTSPATAQHINLVTTGCIASIINVASLHDISVPFFVAGDYATVIVPDCIAKESLHALRLFRRNAYENFKIMLRTKRVDVAEVYAKGHKISIAKFQSTSAYDIPIILGNGIDFAQHITRQSGEEIGDDKDEQPDLTGLKCRWNQIPPPSSKEEIVTLLVVCRRVEGQARVFRQILETLDKIYGLFSFRRPLIFESLKPTSKLEQVKDELKAKMSEISILSLLNTWILFLRDFFFFKTNAGKEYLKKLVEMANTLTIDGKINTIFSGSTAQRDELIRSLDRLERSGEIFYGIHVSKSTVLTCYVPKSHNHFHFVDGQDGGNVHAFLMLSDKMAAFAGQ